MLITSMQVLAIRWVDEADENGPIDMDIFFDRVVIIAARLESINSSLPDNLTLKDYLVKENLAPGVFLNPTHILTSYNPFRYMIPEEVVLKHLYVKVLNKRTIVKPELHEYAIHTASFKCAKQIMTIPDDKLEKNQWHGINKTHSPVHDLMVIQINERFNFLEENTLHSFNDYSMSVSMPAGPILTRYAKKGDMLGRDVKFASLGFRSKRHIKKSEKLASRAYEEDENVLEDCEEWMPRYWGHFICIRNIDNYKGVGSGAVLIYNKTLYGVGSFFLKKGNESILVFTDVRPYTDLLLNNCSDLRTDRNDPTNGRRNSGPSTTITNDYVDDYYAERDYL